ncbi:MAG: hypothetical protein ACTHOC_12775 [Luteimonas sp.]
MPTTTQQEPPTPLTQRERTHRFKKFGKGFNQQRKITLPLSAWKAIDQVAKHNGISVPGLLLALTNADPTTLSQLREWAIDAAHSHQHFMEIENEDGTHTRVQAGLYRRGGRA